MHSEIKNTATACEREITKPCLVRPVTVVKLRIDSKHFTQRTTLNKRTHRSHRRYRAVRQIDSQQTVCRARRIDYLSRLMRIPAKRLLTEHRRPTFERCNRLLRVKAIGRRNPHSIKRQIQQLLKRSKLTRIARQFVRFIDCACLHVVKRSNLRHSRFCHRLEPIPSDPTQPDNPETRRWNTDLPGCSTHIVINAFTNPSGERSSKLKGSDNSASLNACV